MEFIPLTVQAVNQSADNGSESGEYKAFTKLYKTLLDGIEYNLLEVSIEAFSKQLIGVNVKKYVTDTSINKTRRERTDYLLEAIHERIKTCPETFDQFSVILKSENSLEYLADKLACAWKEEVSVEAVRSPNQPQPVEVIDVGPSLDVKVYSRVLFFVVLIMLNIYITRTQWYLLTCMGIMKCITYL